MLDGVADEEGEDVCEGDDEEDDDPVVEWEAEVLGDPELGVAEPKGDGEGLLLAGSVNAYAPTIAAITIITMTSAAIRVFRELFEGNGGGGGGGESIEADLLIFILAPS